MSSVPMIESGRLPSEPTRAPVGLCVLGTVLYVGLLAALLLVLPEDFLSPESRRFILILGFIGIWRYSWASIHAIRALLYYFWKFPQLRAEADRMGARGRPPHLYLIVASYRTEPEVSASVYEALIEEVGSYGVPATIIASVSDTSDEMHLRRMFRDIAPPPAVSLVVMRQDGTGKRAALAEALRAVARCAPEPGSLLVLMDGDVRLPAGTLNRIAPLFAAIPDLGAVTTDNRGITSGSNWVKEWYEMRFAQRHILMCSMSLSRRVLVLTGRFSVFRARIASDRDFIAQVERDSLLHWRFGDLKFLTGDDKSTWFWLLKRGAPMLYVPDVQIHSYESLPDRSLIVSTSKLMTRWFGNMLRNNGRAIALGPRRVGWFTWWALVDQRLSMWTSLTGPVFATMGSVAVSPILLPVYGVWVMMTRLLQAVMAGGVRGRFSPYMPFLLYYTQIVGSFVKIAVSYRLNRQKWTRQNIGGTRANRSLKERAVEWVSHYIHGLSLATFLLAMALFSNFLPMPDWAAIGARAASDTEDGAWIQVALDRADQGATVRVPAGRFVLQAPLVLARDGVSLAGAGAEKTVLLAGFPGDGTAVVSARGEIPAAVAKTRCGILASAASALDNRLSLDRALDVGPGDFVSLRARNDDAFLEKLGARVWRKDFPHLRQALAGVAAVAGPTLVIEGTLLSDFPVGTEVCPLRLLRDVGISGLTIVYRPEDRPLPDPSDYTNSAPAHRVDGVAATGVADLVIADVVVRGAGRHALSLDTVLRPRVSDFSAFGAYNKGTGGNGYVRLARTFEGRFTRMKMRGMRHLTIQWSSHGNEFTALDTDSDVNFHGGYAHHNVVQVDFLEPRPGHPWRAITRTPDNAAWAPPDGPANRVTVAGRARTAKLSKDAP